MEGQLQTAAWIQTRVKSSDPH